MQKATILLGDIIKIQKVFEKHQLLLELNKINLIGITINYHTWIKKRTCKNKKWEKCMTEAANTRKQCDIVTTLGCTKQGQE